MEKSFLRGFLPKMNFRFAIKTFLLTLLFIADKMKCNFISGVVFVKFLIEKCKQTRARYRGKHVEGSNEDIY